MSLDWVYPLDALAASGAIDFDAAAFILDKPARYAGSPRYEDIDNIDNTNLLGGTKLKPQPNSDLFEDNSGKNIVNNPSWKKWLAGGIAAVAVGAITIGTLVSKGKIKLPKMTGLKTTFNTAKTTVVDFFKNIFKTKKPTP